MLASRALVLIGAAPVGLAIGSAVWLFAARPPGADVLPVLAQRVAAIAPHRNLPRGGAESLIAQAIAAPLFAMTTGPGAVADVVLRLEGLVRSPGRVAALISIGGAPSDWLEVGQTRDGVTLQEVMSSNVVVDTATGLKDVPLGGGGGPATAAAPASPAVPPPMAAPTPPAPHMRGLFRSPPEPASAPGMPK